MKKSQNFSTEQNTRHTNTQSFSDIDHRVRKIIPRILSKKKKGKRVIGNKIVLNAI